MEFPHRFPFDALDPAPGTQPPICQSCGCSQWPHVLDVECQQPECHGDLELRYLYGDR